MKTSTKKLRRIYIDTNVLVGCFRGVKADVEAMKFMFQLNDNELYTSSLAIAQTISTLQGRKKDLQHRKQIIDYINHLMHHIKIIGFSEADIKVALTMSHVDIEDNIQFVLGAKQHCYIYITNNIKDFKYNNVYVESPKYIRNIKSIMNM